MDRNIFLGHLILFIG